MQHLRGYWKIYTWAIALIAALIFLVCLFLKINSPQTLPINKVVIVNTPRKYQSTVEKAVRPLLDEGFFKVNVSVIQKTLEQYPWVSQVQVQRVWPHQLSIIVKPQKIIARWNHQHVLNNYGEVFSQGEVVFTKQLPILQGPANSQLKMLGYYQKANQLLKLINLSVVKMTLNADNDWQLRLNNDLVVKLGHNQRLTRLQHFVKVYPKVFAGKQAISVDLRYPSGMAVDWKN